MTSEIPPDIISDILCRLPTKSLCRFKCVSNTWLSQISDPQFINRHRKTLNRRHLICDSDNDSLSSLPINPHDHQNPTNLTSGLVLPHADVFVFHGSCNGLVLCSVNDFDEDDAHSLVIFNPTTREFVQVPESGLDVVDKLSQIDIRYGFGYDPLTDDYKVVTISYFHYNYLIPPGNMSVHIYSLRNNTWKWAIDSSYDHSHVRGYPSVFVNGLLHCIAYKGSGSGSDRLPVIVGFSLADEKFSEVILPDFGDRVDVLSQRGCKLVGGEKLGVFFRDAVWLMNEYGVRESWLKIDIDGLNKTTVVDPEIVYEDGKILLLCRYRMWVYDVAEKSFCKSIDISSSIKGLRVSGTYVESLVSPKFR